MGFVDQLFRRKDRKMNDADIAVDNSAGAFAIYLGDARHEQWRRRKQYYDTNQFQQVTAESWDPTNVSDWNSSWSGHGWDNLRAMIPHTIDNTPVMPVPQAFVASVINGTAVVYQAPVRARTIKSGDSVDESATELVKRIYDAAKDGAAADIHCKHTYLFGTHFQFVYYEKHRKRVRLINKAPYEVFVHTPADAPDDIQHPDTVLAVLLDEPTFDRNGQMVTRPRWQVWAKDETWIVEGTDLTNEIEGTRKLNPYFFADPEGPFVRDGVRGYSIRPVIVSHSIETTDIYYSGSDWLVAANQTLDRNMTSVTYAMTCQGFSVPVITGMSEDQASGIVLSPGSPVVIDSMESPNAGLEYKNPAPPIGEHTSATVKIGRMAARGAGIDPEMVDPDSKVVSGVSRAQNRTALQERREGQVPHWHSYEREKYWIVSHVWNATQAVYGNGTMLPLIPRDLDPANPNAPTIEVQFGNVEIATDPLADTLDKRNRVDIGLVTVPELIAQERRISLESAKAIFEENNKFNLEIKRREAEVMGQTQQPKQSTLGGMARLGQPGNRPQDPNREPSRSGGTTTANTGNNTLAGS